MSASNSQGEDDFPTPVFTAIRQKPVRSKNQGQNPGCNVVLNPKGCEISIFESNGYKEAFKFDHVLPEDVSQSEVFTRVFDNPRTSFIDLILDGFDLFVIGYGGAGCGKTFTLFGPNSLSEPSEIQSEADHGIMSRFAWRIFENLEHEEMTVKVSSYEIINNEPFDLLVYQDPSPSNRRRSSLCGTIKSDIKVNPAAEIECASAGDVIRNYENARQVLEQFKSVSGSVSDSLGGEATTESSHMFFKIIVEQRNGLSGKKSSVTFVDLASRSTDVGLSSLLHLVRALGGVSNSGIVHYDLSLLTHELKNALGGRALTLVLGCISPENVSETRDTLMFAQTVSNIRNRPKPNIAQVVNEFPNDEEELKYINNSLKFSKPALPPMPMMMPDLINPNPNHVDYMLQMQLQNQIQMQMLNTYMLMHHQNGSQQQQLKQGSPSLMSSPFKPISSPSGSLKSPLNNMQMPQQPQPQMYLNANENNVPLNLPAQKSRENAETERGANPTQNRGAQPEPPFKKNSRRKSSLTQKMAKNLDSILEDSEHDSSTCLEQKSSSEGSCSSSVSSFNEAPEDFNEDQEDFNENQEDFDEDQEDFKEDSEDFNSDEEDFDSDCSVASDELEQELLGINNYQADLIQFQKTTDKLVEKQQSEMIERIMKSEPNSPLFPAEPYLDQNKMNREQLPGIVHQPRIVSWEAFNNSKSEGVNQIVTKSIELPKVNNFEETRLLQAAAQEISSNKTRKYPNQVDLVAQQLSNLELETSPDKSELVPDIEYYRDRVSQMLQFKDALLGEKQSMEDDHDKRFRHTARPDKNFGGPEPKTQRDSDIEKRKVEIEVFFEAIDTLIDLKNATITNLQYEKPSVDDPSEQDFLMKQLDALSSDEAKHLSHSFMHKIIDHRIEGRAKDRQLRSLDEKERNLNKEIKDLRKYSAHRDVKYQDLKKDLRKSDRLNRDKDNQIEVLTEKLEKYKAYWKMNQKGSGERYVSSGSGTKPSEMITQEGIEIIEQAKPTVVRREKNRLTIGTTDSFDKAKY